MLFRQVPTKGSLDLAVVKDSIYFFSWSDVCISSLFICTRRCVTAVPFILVLWKINSNASCYRDTAMAKRKGRSVRKNKQASQICGYSNFCYFSFYFYRYRYLYCMWIEALTTIS
jgi:hypothetical protein